MEFAEFATRARKIETVSAETETVSLVAELLVEADTELVTVTRFVRGRVFPAHDPTKLDIGPALCYAALAKAAGPNVTAGDIEDRLADVGEIGAVAAGLELGGQRGLGAFGGGGDGALTVDDVDTELRSLAAAAGSGSTDTKLDILFGLFNRTDPDEARFLARLVLGNMRIGVGDGVVRDAIAEAFDVPVGAVERAIQLSNDLGLVAETARDGGKLGVEEIRLIVGRPIEAMLAQAGTAVDALEQFDRVAVETKFDGARVQLHYDGETARLFSRNLEDVTDPITRGRTLYRASTRRAGHPRRRGRCGRRGRLPPSVSGRAPAVPTEARHRVRTGGRLRRVPRF